MQKDRMSILLDILLDKWIEYLTSTDILIIMYICNEMYKKGVKEYQIPMRDIGSAVRIGQGSVYNTFEKTEVFGIFVVDKSMKTTKVKFGKKLNLALIKKKRRLCSI